MKKNYEMSTGGLVWLIIFSVLSFGFAWLGYLFIYGMYEWAYKSLKNANEEEHEAISGFGVLSLVFYWLLPLIYIVIIVAVMSVISRAYTNGDSAATSIAALSTGILVIIITIAFIGAFFGGFAIIQLGIRKIFYPRYQLSDSFLPCIIVGSILTFGFIWLAYLLMYGVYELYIHSYYKSLTYQRKELSTFGVVSLVFYIILMSIALISDLVHLNIFNLIISVIEVFGMYGFVQFALLQMSHHSLEMYDSNFPAFDTKEEENYFA